MGEVWVVNASPLIVLAKIGRLDLVERGCHTLVLPDAVAKEISMDPADDPARQALASGWGPRPLFAEPDVRIVEWGLGDGETAVLSIVLNRKAVAVIDDLMARRAAATLGIRVIGTLGIVLRGCKEGRVKSSVETLNALVEAGLRLDDDVIRTALKRSTGEDWPG